MNIYLLIVFILHYLWIGHCVHSIMTFMGARKGMLPWLFNLVLWPFTLMLLKDRMDVITEGETDE